MMQLKGMLKTYRNPMRQLQTVVNIMSHAKLSEQKLYMLCIDFSSAFTLPCPFSIRGGVIQ